VPEKSAENIDDLINGYYVPYLVDGALKVALEEQIKQETDIVFKQKIIELNRTVSKLRLNDVLKLLKDQQKLEKLSKKLTALKSEIAMPYIKGFLDRIFRVRTGRELYFQNLITPICFRPDFLYISVANNM
jgi:hypothetical protein